ncbi:MAG: hypothetical protein KDF65_04125 [Anaerolineae bacterium]|nr:hypothetical protein [Anaerolineae bacterium]
MNVYFVEPLKGINPILFGMTREESRSAVGTTPFTFRKNAFASTTDTDAYFDHCFQVFFDKEYQVDFIELSTNDSFKVVYKGIDIFNTEAARLIESISKDADYEKRDPELGYSYIFPELELSLWRPVVPENQNDLEGRYFSTVGIGRRGFSASLTDTWLSKLE